MTPTPEGVTAQLAEQICDYVARDGRLEMLSAEEAERLLRVVASRFGFPQDRVWWWECVSQPTRAIDYADGAAGLRGLLELLPSTDEAWHLFVTDDDPPPWLGVRGAPAALVAMLEAHPFFEYFVVDSNAQRIVFDTHHNRLIEVHAPA